MATDKNNKVKRTSIIVRTVDRPEYLRECLLSLALQEGANVEIVIVNDGGPDISQLIASWKLPLDYKLIQFDLQRGRSLAANAALEITEGEYIGFLDDDDIFYPCHISKLISHIEERGLDAAYSISLCAKQAICGQGYKTNAFEIHHKSEFSYKRLLSENYLPICSVLFKRELALNNVDFDPDFEALEDWDFWIRLLENAQVGFLPEITSEYRVRDDGTNTTGQFEHLWIWSRNHIAQKHAKRRGAYQVEEEILLS